VIPSVAEREEVAERRRAVTGWSCLQ